jgi:gliding motility-associated-like protein
MISILNRISFRRFLLVAVFAVGGGYNALSQSYCKPSLGSCCEWISNVSLGSIDHSTTNESGHADYTNISTVVAKGVTYPINIKVSNNSVYVEHVKVYFDWDRDYIFETTLYLGSAKFTGTNVFSGEITIPVTAKNGCSMMRVFMQYAQQPSGACSSLGDGEIEDYTIVVSNTSAPVADFTFPSLQACVQSSIPFTNSSSISEEVILSYRWNFGDGTISTAANPTKKYTTAGNYNVKLTTSTFCTSHAVTKTITIGNYPTITLQPVSTAICSGTNTSFTVAANSGNTFKWQVNKGSGFVDIINSGTYSQSTTSKLIITGVTTSMNGYQYRCLVSTSCTVTSSAAVLTILEPPVITSNPVDASVCVGRNTTFSVTATGSGLSYQWQQNSGEGFTDLINGGAASNVTSRTLSISGAKEVYQNYSYRCVVTGGCSSTSTVAALSINAASIIMSHPTDTTVLEGTNASFRTESSGSGVTYQWQENAGSGFVNLTNNANYSNVTSSTLEIIETPLSKTDYRYRCLVSTDCTPSLISEQAVLKVNSRTPAITSKAPTRAKEDVPYNYTFRVSDETGNPLRYSALVKPDWLSINPLTGVLSGTPSNDDVGIHTITLRVGNGIMNVDQIFTITVSNSNDAPNINSAALTVVKEDEVYSYTLVATDIDEGSVLSYSAPKKPSWLTFTPDTRVLRGTPTNNDIGIHNVTLQVADDSVSVDQNFTINVVNVNDVPVITSVAVVHVDEDSPYRYTVSVDDVDSLDIISFSSLEKPSWLTFDEMTGVLTGIPSNSEVGSHQVTLTASDGYVKVDQNFTIVVKNVNDAPLFISQPVTATYEDEEYTYILAALDVDKDTFLNYAVLEKPEWLSFDINQHLLYGTPMNKDVGSHVIRLKATDGIVDINQSFTLDVINVNDAPIITSSAEISIEKGVNYNYVLTAIDPDSEDVLRYAAVTKPGWLTFNTNNGILNGTPQKNDVGVHNITLRVNDGSLEVDQSFTVSVTTVDEPAPVDNFKPTRLIFSAKTFESSFSINEALGVFTTLDPDDTDHVYALVNGDGDLNNNLFSVEDDKLYLGSQKFPEGTQFSIRVKSTDAHGNFIEEIFQLEKIESNMWDIQIPTTFSPDGDGVNDTWVIKDLKQFKDVSVQVFDRSGVPLYTSNDPEQGWDGRAQGRILEGPFFYIVKIHDKLAVRKGVLIVIR